jgi:hypothetical protein
MRNRKALISALLVTTCVAGLFVMNAHALCVVTGRFRVMMLDTSTPRTINTGLTNVRSLRIYVYSPRGPVEVAYTTDQIQSDMPGAFLNKDKWDTGLPIVGGQFTLNHPMFKRGGTTLYWEALGD